MVCERYSYFMTAEAVGNNPGLGLSVGELPQFMAYTLFVYMLSLPGGWIADNIWGQRKAVLIGGIIIAMGHFSMPYRRTHFSL